MRLLIVEDNEELAELLAKGLQTAGYQADVLSTVEEATKRPRHDILCGPDPGPRIARRRRPRAVARDPAPQQSYPGPGADRARRPAGPRSRPAQRRGRLSGEAVRAGGIDRAAGSAVAPAGPPARQHIFASPISNSIPETGKPRSTISPNCFSAREIAVLELLMRSKGRVVSKKQVEDHIFGHSGGRRVERDRGLCPPPAQAAFRAWRQGPGPHHSRRRLPHRGGKVACRGSSRSFRAS